MHDSGGFLSYFLILARDLKARYGMPVIVHFRYLLHRHQAIYGDDSDLAAASVTACRFETETPEATQCLGVRIADHVICPSNDDATFVRQAYRPATDTLTVLPDPVDPTFLAARPRPSHPGHRMLFRGQPDNPLKGGDIVLDAFPALRARFPDLKLVMAGESSDAMARGTRRARIGGRVEYRGNAPPPPWRPSMRPSTWSWCRRATSLSA